MDGRPGEAFIKHKTADFFSVLVTKTFAGQDFRIPLVYFWLASTLDNDIARLGLNEHLTR